jgi:hypothetical protein
MKILFIKGGPFFMWVLTILLTVTIAWIIYHFILGYCFKQTDKVISLRKLSYGKSMGLFALITGILGQIFGFSVFFSLLEEGAAKSIDYAPSAIFRGLEATIIVTIYGILIYLLSILLWLIASTLIKKKLENQYSA